MQNNVFVGNLAKAPTITGAGERAVTRFTSPMSTQAGILKPAKHGSVPYPSNLRRFAVRQKPSPKLA